jgi:hypothetical protein
MITTQHTTIIALTTAIGMMMEDETSLLPDNPCGSMTGDDVGDCVSDVVVGDMDDAIRVTFALSVVSINDECVGESVA